MLSPYTDYLVQRWNGGCRDTRRLYEEIHQQGYPGSYATVARYTQRLGLAQGLPPRHRSVPRQGPRRGPLPAVAHGEAITTSFVESTVNEVVSKRFCKKQQMQWSKAGAHLLLQTRVQTLNGDLSVLFKRWYPDMDIAAEEMPAAA